MLKLIQHMFEVVYVKLISQKKLLIRFLMRIYQYDAIPYFIVIHLVYYSLYFHFVGDPLNYKQKIVNLQEVLPDVH